jgi:Ca2+-transporting ATPase
MTDTDTSAAARLAWHNLSADDVADALSVDPASGLNPTDAAARLAEHGPNHLFVVRPPGWAHLLVRQFASFLVILLLVAAFASGVVLGDWIDAGAIIAIVVLNAIIGFVQESRAAGALAALRDLTSPTARVLRSGAEMEIAGRDVVPGDVLILVAGDRVPADARMVMCRDLEMDESTLTGESLPVLKSVEPVADWPALGDRVCLAFAGTTVARGRGAAIVVATGGQTEMGMVAGLTAQPEPATPLQRELGVVGRRLAAVAIVAAVVVAVLGVVRGVRLETMLLTGVALAVAVIPEGLPTVVAVTLARGVERMAARNALVRRLSAVEALGAAAVICTDKTGTITENRLAVREIVMYGSAMGLSAAALRANGHHPDRRIDRVLDVMVACNDAGWSDDGPHGDPLDSALLRAAAVIGDDVPARLNGRIRVAEAPFDSLRKRMSVVVEDGDRYLHCLKGAPEVVFARATSIATITGVMPLDDDGLRAINDDAERMAEVGLRTIALAYREIDAAPDDVAAAEDRFTLLAVLGLADGARPGVTDSVGEAQRAGIRVVMITGDHHVTARAIGEQVGIVGPDDAVMPGDVLRGIGQDDLDRCIGDYAAFSRVDPVDKTKIVTAWQHHGSVVAMTGDGVNDGPALRAADIGVAMGTGTDVAKEASSVVLADDDFSTIVAAVREGRKIFLNLRNVVHYLLSANASEVITMIVGFSFFGALGEPLRAAQLLWINLVSDGLPALALGLEEPEHDVMADPPGSGRNVLSGRNLGLLATQGAILAAGALGAMLVGAYLLDQSWRATQTMVFTTLVIAQLLHSLNMRAGLSLGGKLGASLVVSLAAHVAVLSVPFTQTALGVDQMGVMGWGWSVALGVAAFLGARLVPRD